MTRRIYDITQPISPQTPVWPGDVQFGHAPTWQIGPGCPVNVAQFSGSTHTGTHADAPLHYAAGAPAIDAVDLAPYLGPARVIDARHASGVVTLADIADRLDAVPPRVLLRSFARFPHDRWPDDFTAIDAALIDHLAGLGCRLIGTDAPSIDPETSKTLAAHNAARRHNLRILEGLVLDAVPPGDYELIALPLPLVGLDASPVRAVLRALA
jgi:arylformamidase